MRVLLTLPTALFAAGRADGSIILTCHRRLSSKITPITDRHIIRRHFGGGRMPHVISISAVKPFTMASWLSPPPRISDLEAVILYRI
jgi:hypothetical protein